MAIAIGLAAAAPGAARAQEPDEHEVGDEPGAQELPPGPDEGDAPTIDPNLEQRRAVRGSGLPEARESDAKAAQRRWDEKAFPEAARAPAEELRDPPPRGKAELPPELSTERVAAPPRAKKKASEVRPDLPWLAKLETGDLPVTWDARVIRYLEFYKDDPKGRSIMSAWLRDQGRFRDLILTALRKHGLPEDLLYVCMIESSYDPWELSRVGAAGLWQFMPAGGRVYGLDIDYWIDERNDPEKATEAAMLHWRDLHERFGDWDLVMAAYNAGYGAVIRAIARFNTNDFWALLERENALPFGSSIYVPKALAAAIVGRNRAIFGYDQIAPAPKWEFDRVSVDRSVSLSVVAKAVGATTEEVQRLNPELKRGRTPPGVKEYSVRIPRGKRELFARTFPTLRADWDGMEAYVVRHGERFEDIAQTYGVPVKKLRELNGVTELAELRGGTTIVVPVIPPEERAKNQKAAEEALYTSGETPSEPGDPLIVAVPDKDKRIEGKKRVFYRVVAGDTLAQVAEALGVGQETLRAWNGLAEASVALHPRMVLVAWVPPGFDAAARHVALLDDSRLMVVTAGSDEHLDVIEGRKGRKRVKVVAKAGDTLEKLGKPHKLSKYDMARINHRSVSKPLEAGEEIIVYVIVDKAKAKKAGVGDDKKKKKSGSEKKKSSKKPS